MKKHLICRMSPLGRPVSQRTMRRKKLMAGNKKGPHKLDTQPLEQFTKSDHNFSGPSSGKSPRMKADDSFASLVSSKKKDCAKNQNHDDNPKGISEIYIKPVLIKRKKSPSLKIISAASRSPRIQKGRNSLLFLSPGKRLLSRSMHGVDEIHRRRTVSMTTVDMKKLEEAIESQIRKKKNRKIDADTLPDGPGISLSANDHVVSLFSSSMSSGMRADDTLADSSKTKEQDDNPQAIDEIYLTPAVLKRKKSSSCKKLASRSPRIQKRRNTMPFVSPGKRLLSRCMHGLDSIHRRHTVSMTTVDMKKLEQAIECQIRKKKNRKLDVNTQQCELEVSINTNDHCVSGLSSSWSSGMKVNDFLADSSRSQEDNPQGIDEMHLEPAEIKRKKSSSSQTMSSASRSPRIQKRRKSMIFVSPGKQLLSRSMRGLDEIHRRRHTVSMTTMDRKKLKEAIERHVRKKKKNKKFDVDMQPHGLEVSFTRDHDISRLSSSHSPGMKADEFLDGSLKSQEKGDVLQMIDEMYLNSEVTKRKKSCKTISLSSRSSRIQKGRNSMPFISPGKRLFSRSMHGLNKMHHHRTVSMTTVEMNKLQEFIDLSQIRKKEENEKVDVKTQPDENDTLLTAGGPNVPDSGSSPGMEADVFLAGLELNKTLDSSQSLKHNEDLQRSNDSFLACRITKRKDSSSCKKICATSRSPRIQKQRNSVTFVSPGKKLLSRSMKGLDNIHRCRSLSMTKLEREKLQEAIDLSHIRKKKKREKAEQNLLGTFKSPSQKMKVTVTTAVDKLKQSDEISCLKRQHSLQEPELTMDDEAEAPEQKKQKETIIHASSTEAQVKSGTTPDLDFKKLDEMYKRRFNPSQECSKADVDFKELDEMYKRRFNPSLECSQTLVNMDTVTRILSFQDEQNDSVKASPPIIQRCAFAQDIIDPESEVSDSTVDELNESLLEKEVRSFFESKKGHSPGDFREGVLALDVASSCIHQETENGVSESELVISAGQKMQSQTVPEHDDIMVIDEDTHYRTPDSRRFIEDVQKLEEETYHSVPDSPRDIADLHKLGGNTHHGTPVSPRDNEHLQKPINIEGVHKLAENTHYSIQDSPRDIEDMQTLEGNTHHGIPDIQRDTEVLPKPRSIEDLQKPSENTSYSVSDSSTDFKDMQKFDKNMHHGTPDSPTNTDDLQQLAKNTSKPCSQENTYSETVFATKKNEQIVPKGKDKLQTLSQKPDLLTHQDHAMDATRNNFGELMPIDVEMDGPWEDMCTPFQHSTPAVPTHSPKSHKISPDDLLSACAEIEVEKKMFAIYCHEDTAPCILKDLDKCPTIIDSRSLSLRYLNDGSSVEVQGMVLMDGHLDKSKKSPKKNRKDAAKKKKKEMEKVLTTAASAEKKKDASKKKKKINAIKETKKKKKETKTETKKELKRKTKHTIKTEGKIEAKQDEKKEVIKEAIEEMKKGTKKKMKKSKVKETNKEAEKEIQKPIKKSKEVKGGTEKENREEAKKKTKKKTDEEKRKVTNEAEKEIQKPIKKIKEVKGGTEKENRGEAKKKTNVEKRKETNKEAEKEIQKPIKKKTHTKKRKEVKSGTDKETGEEAKEKTQKKTDEEKRKVTNEAEKEIKKPTKKKANTKKRKKGKSGREKETRKEAKKKANEEERKVTVTRDIDTGKLKIISGPITNKAEKEIKKPTKKKANTKKRKKGKSGREKETRKEAKKKANEEERKVTVTRDIDTGKLKIISVPITNKAEKEIKKPTKKKANTKKRKKRKIDREKETRKEAKKKANEEERKVTVTRAIDTGKLKIISGPITGAARKRNECRWERELKEQSETPWSNITVQSSMESDLSMLRRLKKMAWTSLNQPAKGHINQDGDQGFEDDDTDLDTFVDLLSFPDVFMTEEKDRPSFRKVPPSEIELLNGS